MANTKFKVKKGDQVIVISGKDKGKKGEILKVVTAKNRVIVSGINTVKKHQRATQSSAAGIVEKELSIHISNIAIVDPKEDVASRVGYKILDNGEKVRISKKSGEVIA